jgi:hypothetical protein
MHTYIYVADKSIVADVVLYLKSIAVRWEGVVEHYADSFEYHFSVAATAQQHLLIALKFRWRCVRVCGSGGMIIRVYKFSIDQSKSVAELKHYLSLKEIEWYNQADILFYNADAKWHCCRAIAVTATLHQHMMISLKFNCVYQSHSSWYEIDFGVSLTGNSS